MNTTYTATYYTASGHFYQATIFLSAVTLTIRYRDEDNNEKDVHWLAKDITDFTETQTGAELQYRNQQGSTERLIMRDMALVQAITKSWRHHRLIGKTHTRVLGSVWTKLAVIFGIMIGLLLIAYLWWVPWLGERMAMRFSKDYEISLGEQMYQSIAVSYKIDEQKTAILNAFYKQLHYDVPYPVQITVVKSDEMNAFAIPGGHIVVYEAILETMKTPEELAALLGHEASHIALRHSLRNIFRSQARKMFLALVMGNELGIISVIVDNADALKGLEYSRSLETEADNNGLQLMVKSSVNTQGMLRLMQMLQKESSGVQPAAFLSTHPVFEERIENIQKQIQQLPAITTGNGELKKIFHSIYE